MLFRFLRATATLAALTCATLLAGCATSDTNHAYHNRTSCPPSFLLYCKTLDHGSREPARKCRCVRQDSFNSIFSGN